MANKKETKTTKKPVEKKTTVKKKVTKKVETKKEEVKVEVKKESKLTKIKDKLKRFFNSSQPLIVVLALMVVALLIYNINYSKHDTVYIGHYLQDNGSIGTIHYFTNHKINLFYATPASFEGDDAILLFVAENTFFIASLIPSDIFFSIFNAFLFFVRVNLIFIKV